MSDPATDTRRWALVLGASSGFGAATAKALAGAGYAILGVHLDRKATLPAVEATVAAIEAEGQEARFFNMNAADADRRREMLAETRRRFDEAGDGSTVALLFHSLAFGALRPFIADDEAEALTQKQMEMTLDVMAHSLVYWVQDALREGLLGRGARIFAMTSEGSSRVWKAYGAVSAAKAALESHIRQLALELGPLGIACNALRAGVTDTPSLRKIPGHETMLRIATAKNPGGRPTVPEDIARAVVALAAEGTAWMSGNTIGIDGGEFIC